MSIRNAKTANLIAFYLSLGLCNPAGATSCRTIDPPQSWSAQGPASPAADGLSESPNPSLNLVVFRHAEKPLRDDGVMIEDGNLGADAHRRLVGLPDRLLQEFGCPDLLVAANPAVKMLNKKSGQYFNYIRPLATIAPVAMKLDFPVWTPYGYNQSDFLARDFLADAALRPKADGAPKTVFVAWERQNIPKLYRDLVSRGNLKDLAGTTETIDGVFLRCEAPQPWAQCDFDSIWFIRIRPAGVCLTRRAENLNTLSFQEKCKGAESVSDAPR